MAESILQEKAYKFALRIVRLSEYLNHEKKEQVISRKILDSGTSVGIFIEEATQGLDRQDFVAKFSLANKEAFKINFWLRVLRDTEFIADNHAESRISDCEELQKMLISSLKTARRND